MCMHKLTQSELLAESIWDKIRGTLKVAGKGAAAVAKGAVKMVTPTGADILKNIKTAVQTGVEVYTKDQPNIIAKKYLQDKYESTGSMFNVKEIGQSKGNIAGQLAPLAAQKKVNPTQPTQPAQTTNTQPVQTPTQTPSTSSTTNTSVTEQVAQPPQQPTQPPTQPPTPQQQQNKIQAQTDDKNWPFRFVFFEADVRIDMDAKRKSDKIRLSAPDKFTKMKFGVKLIKATKDGQSNWTVLGLTNPDGSKFTSIIKPEKDEQAVADVPTSFKKRPKVKEKNPYLADKSPTKTGSNSTTMTSTHDLTPPVSKSYKAGKKVKWTTKKGNIAEGEVIENNPKAKINPEKQITVKTSRGTIVVIDKEKIINESVIHKDIITNTQFKNIFKF